MGRGDILDISSKQRISFEGIASRQLSKKFGRLADYVELHIFDSNQKLLYSEEPFTGYSLSSITEENLATELNMDPVTILRQRDYTSGKYNVVFNVQRKRIFDTFTKIFSIKEISPSRREIKAIANNVPNDLLETAVGTFTSQASSNLFFKDFVINFGKNQIFTCVNLNLNRRVRKYEVLLKLYDPLPPDISTQATFRIAEDIVDRLELEVDMGLPERRRDTGIDLRGPNYRVDTRLNNSVPSAFKNYNQILEYQLTSSYENLLQRLENREIPEIDYDYIRPVSESLEDVDVAYHFENFTHFSSAVERLKNFHYKVKLIEIYDSQIGDINAITGSTSASAVVLNNKESIQEKKRNLIKGFDGYEYFLYYDSGSVYSWPKSGAVTASRNEYILQSITSSTAQNWLGSEVDTNPYYGGQLLSASLYDNQNPHNLQKFVPDHILDNPDNDFYGLFVNMIGNHFDHIWTHIKHITEINDHHHVRGVSKELVYLVLKGLGIENFDQFENDNLIEYILGQGTSGSKFYDVPVSQSLITASNDGSVAKKDISKAIWKRLYHNAPYLLKTKGTERGIKALMSCYGIPSTILNVKEYGGSVTDKTNYKTFSYEKSGLALRGDSGTGSNAVGYFIRSPWSSSAITEKSASSKTIEFRIKPKRSDAVYHLLTLSGSKQTTTHGNLEDFHLVLKPYTGSTDISSSGDGDNYGTLALRQNNQSQSIEYTSSLFPAYNGNFWNIFVGIDAVSGSGDVGQSTAIADTVFGYCQVNHFKNLTLERITPTLNLSESVRAASWGDPYYSGGDLIGGATEVYIGGIPPNPSSSYDSVDGLRYSGSIQEIRFYQGELLTDDTLKKHALEPFMYAGNTTSSAFHKLVVRLPLGSNDKESSGSFVPNTLPRYTTNSDISSSMVTQNWEEIVETHHLPTPDTVGASMTSEKVRIDSGSIDDDFLSTMVRAETSTLDRQPQDFEDLGVFFSPTTEINEDIIYTLGAFRLDDYIGNPLPSVQSASLYEDLSSLREEYFKKVQKRYNYWDYIKLVQYVDHTLFKMVEQWVPFKSNIKTGLLIEPHFLERNKFARELPSTFEGQTMISGSHQHIRFQIDPEKQFTIQSSSVGGGQVVTTNNLLPTTGSDGKRVETGTNFTLDLDYSKTLLKTQNAAQAPIKPYLSAGNFNNKPKDYIAYKSNTLLGNAVKGKKSNRYFRSLDKGKEHDY